MPLKTTGINRPLCPSPRLLRELQLPKGGLDIHPGPGLLFHDRVHSGHHPGHLFVYHVLAGVERRARALNDRYAEQSRACGPRGD